MIDICIELFSRELLDMLRYQITGSSVNFISWIISSAISLDSSQRNNDPWILKIDDVGFDIHSRNCDEAQIVSGTKPPRARRLSFIMVPSCRAWSGLNGMQERYASTLSRMKGSVSVTGGFVRRVVTSFPSSVVSLIALVK
jgi:hypothetical protein